MLDPPISIERLSIEVTNRCTKACWFCYARSHPEGESSWSQDQLVDLVTDCARHGVKSVSFGGGEPLEFPKIFEIIRALKGTIFRSLTTNGLLLSDRFDALLRSRPDKVHVSLHDAKDEHELNRVLEQTRLLERAGIRSGINLLVQGGRIDEARRATARIHRAGIDNARIIFLPMRLYEEPTPLQVAEVAGGPFQSTTCIERCGPSPRFASIDHEQRAGWCSHTSSRQRLPSLDYQGLVKTLRQLDLKPCGENTVGLSRLSRRA